MRRLVVTLIVLGVLGALGYGAYSAWSSLQQRYTPQHCTVALADGGTTTLSAEQAGNASIIVAVAAQRGLPERAAIIAIATAYQESGLRNLDYGDRDSIGLFQQRPSQGWGSVEEIMDPWYSAGKFYDGLVEVSGWESLPLTEAAQAVQLSGFPDAYAKHETNATGVARALLGLDRETLWCVNLTDATTLSPEAFSAVLAALPGVSVGEQADGTLTLTADDADSAWAAANHVIANSYAAGARQVRVGTGRWSATEEGWSTVDSVGDLTVQVRSKP